VASSARRAARGSSRQWSVAGSRCGPETVVRRGFVRLSDHDQPGRAGPPGCRPSYPLLGRRDLAGLRHPRQPITDKGPPTTSVSHQRVRQCPLSRENRASSACRGELHRGSFRCRAAATVPQGRSCRIPCAGALTTPVPGWPRRRIPRGSEYVGGGLICRTRLTSDVKDVLPPHRHYTRTGSSTHPLSGKDSGGSET
jgi:hypothetical protein